jgi:putative tryptophan/tyrosine transport system substrate-binding protein
MNRRDTLLALFALGNTALGWPLAAQAQTKKRPRVGVLWHDASAEAEGAYFKGLIEGFKNLGYVDGRNIILEHRFPNESPEKFASMAAELVAAKVDVLVGVGASSSQYVKSATATIPVVFMYVPDPVRSKLVESLARPGGNATGLTNFAAELTGIRLQFLKEVVPGLSRVALLVNPNAQITPLYINEAQAAAAKLGLNLQVFEARTLDELEPAFDAMEKARMQALTIGSEGLFYQGRTRIAKLALARRLPLSVWSRETLEAGALMSYGPDQVAIARRTAVYVDKILKGAKPADIPVEIPTKFEFLINARTANALGVKIPQSLLLRADELIK